MTSCLASFMLAASVLAHPGAVAADPPPVRSVSDISQEFTFYMDGRFHRQYLQSIGGRDVRNWGSLGKVDLDPFNLLLLTGGNPRIPYTAAARENITDFIGRGGTVLLMADGTVPDLPAHDLAADLGIVLTDRPAKGPLRGVGELEGREIEFRRGNVLELPDSGTDPPWVPLVVDRDGRPVLAAREFERASRDLSGDLSGDRSGAGSGSESASGQGGAVIVGSRGLFGRRPDASDPINAAWVTPMLESRATRRAGVGPLPRRLPAEHSRQVGPLTVEYHDGTARFVEDIHQVYTEVRPHLVEITGCEPSPGMITSLLILPTGGGGFSSGRRIAIGAWWGNYPQRRYPMVELIAHEAGHSWVLPHPEPMWNEPIATYLGIRVGRRMGMPDAEETLQRQIAKARRHDPDLDAVDPQSDGVHRDLVWGKSYFVFEELEREHGPDALHQYFAAKRALIDEDRPDYTMDDCVAVWSRGTGTDLFPWFRSLAFDVDADRTDLWPPSPE